MSVKLTMDRICCNDRDRNVGIAFGKKTGTM